MDCSHLASATSAVSLLPVEVIRNQSLGQTNSWTLWNGR